MNLPDKNKNQASRQSAPSLVVWLSTLVAAMMIAQQIASKAIRDGLFLTEFDVTALPTAVMVAATLSFVSALWFGRFLSRVSPFVAVPILFSVHGALFLLESTFAEAAPKIIAAALYLHTAAFGGAVVSGFWSVINERFDPYTARKVMGKVAGGATFGGVLGGALTWLFADLPIPLLLGGLGVANWMCGFALLAMVRMSLADVKTKRAAAAHRSPLDKRPRTGQARLFDGVSVLIKESYPRNIGLLVLFGAATTALIDYVFKAEVSAGSESLVGFFAMFYTATGVVTFVVQFLGTQRILKWLGVVVTMAAFPVVVLTGLVAAISFPSLITLVALRGGMMVMENSLYRSGYELLYTAVPREQKRSAKILIDLGCDRLGTAFGSGIALALVAAAATALDALLLGIALVAVLVVFVLLLRLRREYLNSLAHRIRRSTDTQAPTRAAPDPRTLASTFIDGAFDYAWDNTTASLQGLPQSMTGAGPSRKDLIEVVLERAEQKKTAAAANGRTTPKPQPTTDARARFLDTPLIRLLRNAEVSDDQWNALRRQAPSMVGQLSDALLSIREPTIARIRAAEILSTIPTSRVVSALVEGVSSIEFRIRRAAAITLLRVCRKRPALAPKMRLLSQHAIRELQRPARTNEGDTPYELTSPFRTDARGKQLAPSLELVFLLLAIAGDGEALRLALDAITSKDIAERGTGLEYLDNLLPANVRTRIIGLVEHPELTQAARSWPADAIATLAERLRSREIGVRQVRLQYRDIMQMEYDRGALEP